MAGPSSASWPRAHSILLLAPFGEPAHTATEVFQQILVLCFKTVPAGPWIQEMYSEVFKIHRQPS